MLLKFIFGDCWVLLVVVEECWALLMSVWMIKWQFFVKVRAKNAIIRGS